uniref:Rhodanese domain-containing protein n=1 Tax=Steinernema glaseri TaxID=37863 RepID=A0A1I7ZK19_9BILA
MTASAHRRWHGKEYLDEVPGTPPLVDVEWLDKNKKDVVILHATYDPECKMNQRDFVKAYYQDLDKRIERFKSDEYKNSHIPKAIEFSINCATYPGRTEKFYLYTPLEVSRYLQRLAIFPDEHIVVYSSGPFNGMLYASKVRWLLKLYEFTKVSVLDGGLGAWKKAGKPVTDEVYVLQPSVHVPGRLNLDEHVNFSDLTSATDDRYVPILHQLQQYNFIDCRPAAQFQGRAKPSQFIDWQVSGTFIQHSKNLPSLNLVTTKGFMASKQEIRRAAREAKYDKNFPTVLFCYDGMQCHLVGLAMEHAGYPPPKIYAGGLVEIEMRQPNFINGQYGCPLY